MSAPQIFDTISKVGSDWSYTGLLSSNGGLLFKNVMHAHKSLAIDMRMVRVWVASEIPEKQTFKDRIENFTFGGTALPPTQNKIDHSQISIDTLIKPYAPIDCYKAKFSTVNPIFGPGSQKLALEQEFRFTKYSGQPKHEPLGILSAARVYPLLHFKYAADKADKVPLKYIRADYRMEIQIDQALQSSEGGFLNQAGVFADEDSGLGFSRAEKPLAYELLGEGLNKGAASDWDNLHQWGAQGSGTLPYTPGAFHACHCHWRWPSVVASVVASVFGDDFGAGRALVDPRIPNQTLRFAVAAERADLSAELNGSTKVFGDLFEGASLKTLPREIEKGEKISTWFSFEAFRTAEEIARNRIWHGTFFVNGIFFAHNDNPWYMSLISSKGKLQKPVPTRHWRRPQYLPHG